MNSERCNIYQSSAFLKIYRFFFFFVVFNCSIRIVMPVIIQPGYGSSTRTSKKIFYRFSNGVREGVRWPIALQRCVLLIYKLLLLYTRRRVVVMKIAVLPRHRLIRNRIRAGKVNDDMIIFIVSRTNLFMTLFTVRTKKSLVG